MNNSNKGQRFHYTVHFAEGGYAAGQTNAVSVAACEAKLRSRYSKRNVTKIEVRK